MGQLHHRGHPALRLGAAVEETAVFRADPVVDQPDALGRVRGQPVRTATQAQHAATRGLKNQRPPRFKINMACLPLARMSTSPP